MRLKPATSPGRLTGSYANMVKTLLVNSSLRGRLGEIMIDLFVLASTLSRVQSSIEINGLEAASREIDILRIFTRDARGAHKAEFPSY